MKRPRRLFTCSSRRFKTRSRRPLDRVASPPMELFVEDIGAGAPVVLAHAGVTDRRVWDLTVLALLDAGYRVIRYDAPGYGLSPMPSEPYSFVDIAQRVLDQTRSGPVHWVGLSAGAATGA